ncbi:DUF2953 domain-containing protein [Desulforamulus reducens]|uniref:DUF2953 domain-containing protein n=1 Tax=Desulforamulus reducens TaxID=59610 RepID=UPI001EE43B01|nr:DUF2953 domain-containing protein [Desulforamulus reducens]
MHFKYFRVAEDDTISFEFFLLGFIHYKIEVPVVIFQQKLSGISLTTRTELETGGDHSEELLGKQEKRTISSIGEAKNLCHRWWPFFRAIKPDMDYLLAHLSLERFVWKLRIGTGDAAVTGIITGVAWGIMGSITSLFYKKIATNKPEPELQVEPNFKKEVFSTSIDCIFKIRVVNIMVTGIKILQKKVKRRGVNDVVRTSH